MRPWAINSSCMEGMLESMLVARRCDQKPSRISTELTGTVLSFANGEPETSITPARFHELAEVSEGGAPASELSEAAMRGRAWASAAGTTVAAAEARKLRREILDFIDAAPFVLRHSWARQVLRAQLSVLPVY